MLEEGLPMIEAKAPYSAAVPVSAHAVAAELRIATGDIVTVHPRSAQCP